MTSAGDALLREARAILAHVDRAPYDWAFLFRPGLVVGFGNGLMLGYLMHHSGLVPRRMAMLGLIGGPMLIVSFGFILFGVYEKRLRARVPDGATRDRLGSLTGGLHGLEGSQAERDTETVDHRELAAEPSMPMA